MSEQLVAGQLENWHGLVFSGVDYEVLAKKELSVCATRSCSTDGEFQLLLTFAPSTWTREKISGSPFHSNSVKINSNYPLGTKVDKKGIIDRAFGSLSLVF